jgi:hypothetical protein
MFEFCMSSEPQRATVAYSHSMHRSCLVGRTDFISISLKTGLGYLSNREYLIKSSFENIGHLGIEKWILKIYGPQRRVQTNTHCIKEVIYKTYETHYKPWLDFSQYASIPRHHPLCAMSPSTKSHIYVLNQFSVAYSMYITPQNSY